MAPILLSLCSSLSAPLLASRSHCCSDSTIPTIHSQTHRCISCADYCRFSACTYNGAGFQRRDSSLWATVTRKRFVVCMAPEEEKMTRRSPLDFPIEWERPRPGRRPDIFPQFSPMKTPLPPPLPADPPEEEEDEEEKKEEEDPDKEPEKPEE